jgi:hypothetical protein
VARLDRLDRDRTRIRGARGERHHALSHLPDHRPNATPGRRHDQQPHSPHDIGQASTLTRLVLDLDADDGGFGHGPVVLIVDEAGMASTRQTAHVLRHAHLSGVKVIAIGDSGQL